MEGVPIPQFDAIDDDLLLRHARSFWDRVRGSRSMPDLPDIDPVEMPRSILPHVLLSNVLEHPRRHVCRLAGTRVEEQLGSIKGKTLDNLNFGGETSDTLRQYDDTVLYRRATYCCHDFTDSDGLRYRFKRLLMPLSPNDEDVQWLFGIILFYDLQHSPRYGS